MRAAILLAAGSSRRFGRANKLLARFAGQPLLAHALTRAKASGVGRVIVVTGSDRVRVGRVARAAGAAIVHARDHREGIGASLRHGLNALRPIEREVLIYLGDMPFAPPVRWRIPSGCDAVRPRSGGVPGHPVLLRRPPRATIAQLGGDSGLGPLLGRVRWIAVAPALLADIDRRADMRGTFRLSNRLARRWKR